MKKKKQNNIGEFDLNTEFDLNMEFDLNTEIWENQDPNQEPNQENEARTKQGEFTLEAQKGQLEQRGNKEKNAIEAVKKPSENAILR